TKKIENLELDDETCALEPKKVGEEAIIHIAGGQLDNEKLTELKDYGFIGHIDGGQLLLDS
ncbi:hypothetical protein ACJX0J_021076, partial [Zea mays]